MTIKNLLSLLICLSFAQLCFSQPPPAFPGAEGFGANTTGGRGGQVIYVTNLNPNGPGSFAEALATEGKRYILFKVSGVIDAAAELIYGDVTIAGQTSPGGIIVRGFVIDEVYDTIGTGDNIIIRHLRSRPHDVNFFPSSNYILDDACRLDGASNVIIDHCSFANAVDECVQISQSNKISFQNNSLAETIGEHYYLGGMLLNYSSPELPQDSISIHHNVWNRLGGRLPELSCESPYASSRPLNLELSNNIIWDQAINIWYNSNIDPSSQVDSFFLNLNWVNNYAVARSTFGNGMIAHNILEIAANNIFAFGNKLNLYPAYSDYDLFYCCNDFNLQGNNPNTDLGVANRLSNRHPFPAINYHSTDSLMIFMIANSGAFPRDSMDKRLFLPLTTGTIDPTPIDELDHYQDAFVVATNPPAAPHDTDEDGMPNYWEKAHGLNPAVQDHNGTNLSVSFTGVVGYTNLECYLNILSDSLIRGTSTIINSINEDLLETKSYMLDQNYPNPFNPNTIIRFSIPRSGLVTLKVFDIMGKEVAALVNEAKTPGNYEVEWNGSNLPSGVYFYKLLSGDYSSTRKMILMK